MGATERYECGIFERPKSWFNTLGLRYKAVPDLKHCMMHHQERCYRDFKFDFGYLKNH